MSDAVSGVWNEATMANRRFALELIGRPSKGHSERKWSSLPKILRKQLRTDERLWVPDLVERDVRGE